MRNVVIFTSPNCSYCTKAKDVLDRQGIPYTAFDINQEAAAKTFLIDSGLTTVPQVYVGGQHVGGYEDLQDYLQHTKEANDPTE